MAGTAEIRVRIPDRCARINPKMNVFIKAKRFCDSSCMTFAWPLHDLCITLGTPRPEVLKLSKLPLKRAWNFRRKRLALWHPSKCKKCKKCKNAKNAKVSSEMNVSISQHVSQFSAQRFPAHFPNTSHHTLQRIPMRISVRAHSIPLNSSAHSIPLNSNPFHWNPLNSVIKGANSIKQAYITPAKVALSPVLDAGIVVSPCAYHRRGLGSIPKVGR